MFDPESCLYDSFRLCCVVRVRGSDMFGLASWRHRLMGMEIAYATI